MQIFDKATSVKTIYKQSSETDIPSHVPAQTLCHYILDFNPSTVSAEIDSVVSPFQSGKEKFQSVRVCILTVIQKWVGYGTPVPSTSLRQVPLCYCDSVFYRRGSKRPATSVPGVQAPPAFLQCDTGYASVYRASEQQSSGHSLFY